MNFAFLLFTFYFGKHLNNHLRPGRCNHGHRREADISRFFEIGTKEYA